jgi:hypothetical protein
LNSAGDTPAAHIPAFPGEEDICKDCAAHCAAWRRMHVQTMRDPWSGPKSAADIRWIIQSGRDPRDDAPNSIARIVSLCSQRHG